MIQELNSLVCLKVPETGKALLAIKANKGIMTQASAVPLNLLPPVTV